MGYKFGPFLKKLRFKKITNASGLVFGFLWSKITGSAINTHYPVAIAIEPTTSCNLRCPECPSGLRSFTRPTGKLSLELFQKIIADVKDTLMYLTFYFQGEPYLHKDFLGMVKIASDNHIYTSTSTNAHYLSPEVAEETVKSGLDKIIISIDGTTQETYEAYRIGGKLEKVIEGTKNLVAAKKKLGSDSPFISFQFLVVRPNEHQIEDVKKLAKFLEVNELLLKTAQIYDYENGSDLIPNIEKYARYKKDKDGKYSIKNKLINHCWKMWHSCVITWDGTVVACCFDKDANHKLGNLNLFSFKEIWNNVNYVSFRSALIKSRKNIEICTNCTEGTEIWG
jgi:radical SAM protein with 4Fe4S-binding SPASM domain